MRATRPQGTRTSTETQALAVLFSVGAELLDEGGTALEQLAAAVRASSVRLRGALAVLVSERADESAEARGTTITDLDRARADHALRGLGITPPKRTR
jgi:hypothetical protein